MYIIPGDIIEKNMYLGICCLIRLQLLKYNYGNIYLCGMIAFETNIYLRPIVEDVRNNKTHVRQYTKPKHA